MPSIASTAYSHKAHNHLCQDPVIAKKTPRNAAGEVRRSEIFWGFGIFFEWVMNKRKPGF